MGGHVVESDPVAVEPVLHLEECDPEQHRGWRRMSYREALAAGGRMCPDTQYMADELFADETVWAETGPAEALST